MRVPIRYVLVLLAFAASILGAVAAFDVIGATRAGGSALFWGVGGALFILAGLFFWSWRAGSHWAAYLDDLGAALRQLGEGRYDAFFDPGGPPEFGVLARTGDEVARRVGEEMAGIKKAQRLLEAVLGSMVSGVLVVDSQARIIMANPAAVELLNLQGKKVVGEHYSAAIFHPDLTAGVPAAIYKGIPARTELTVGQPPRQHTFVVSVTPLRGIRVETGAVLLLHDITALRNLERSRRELVANISHELKTPVTAIRGFAETLLQGGLDRQEEERFLHIMLDEAERLSHLVGQLLELSILEAPSFQLQTELVDLRDVAAAAASAMEGAAREKGITIRLRAGEERVRVQGDRQYLVQAVTNLVDNAIKFSPPDAAVTVEVRREGDHAVLSVTDDGPGIPAEHLPHVFERFYRVDSSRSRSDGGAGLGLAIVKHIMQAHGGEAGVESKAGQGSTFWLKLAAVPEETR